MGGNPSFFFFLCFYFFIYYYFFFFILLFLFHFIGIKRPKKSSMGKRLHLKEKFSIKNQGSISSPFSFFYLVFLPFFPLRTMWNLSLGEGILFLIFQNKKKTKKNLPMIRIWLKFLIIFRNHSHCLNPVVNFLLDLV